MSRVGNVQARCPIALPDDGKRSPCFANEMQDRQLLPAEARDATKNHKHRYR